MNKSIKLRLNWDILGILILLGLSLYIILLIITSEQLLFGLLLLVGLIFVVFFSRNNIYIPFAFVFLVGSVQGIMEIYFSTVDIGNLKYGILLIGGGVFLLRCFRKPTMLRGISKYFILMIIFYFVYLIRILIPSPTSDQLKYQISLWGVLNLPLVLLFYGDTKNLRPIYSFIKLIIRLGMIASIFGLIQFILGPDRLVTLGINVYKLKYSFFDLSNVNTFRVFSTFPSHYEFASFMVIAILAKLILHLHRREWPKIGDVLVFFLLLIGLAITYNVTLWLTLLGCIVCILIGWSGGKNIRRLFLHKKIITISIFALISIVMIFSLIAPVRERIVGIFNVSPAASLTAGASLFWRIQIFHNLINLIKEFPLGLGTIVQNQVTLLQTSRGYFIITSDVYLAWLCLIGGIPLFFLYLLLFFVPIIKAFLHRKVINDEDKALFWGIFSVLFVGVLLGGFSNSALTNSTPSNLLVWASIGVLLRLIRNSRLLKASYNG
jgi:hypothetical protein